MRSTRSLRGIGTKWKLSQSEPSQFAFSHNVHLVRGHITKPSSFFFWSNHVMRECFDTEENITSGCSVGSGQSCSSRVLAPVILPADSRFVPPAATVYRPGRGDAAAAGGAARLADTVGQLRLGEEVVMGTTRQSGWRSTTQFSLSSTDQGVVPVQTELPLSVPSSSLG